MLLMATSAGKSYKQHPPEGVFDAIVIGSGMGGMTAAAMLARHGGRRVLVLERHYTAGGFTHVFRRPGYEWDVGVHYIGRVSDPHSPERAMFDHVTEGRLAWTPMPDLYDQFFIGGREYALPSGVERFRESLRQRFPASGQAITRYLEAIRAATRSSRLYYAEKVLPAALARIAGPLLRYPFLRHAGQSTAAVLAGITSDPQLAAVLAGQWGDYGLPPRQSSFGIHAMVAKHYLEGAAYPVGGASRIAAGIEPVIERAGGSILVSADVTGILVENGNRATGVRMADGRELRARIVISDAGARNTFVRLLPAGAAGKSAAVASLQRIPPSMAHLCLYVGLKRESGDPEFGESNLWVFPGPDHDANVARFQADANAPFPALFISFPSAKDPTFSERYPGRSTIEVVAPAPFEWFARWEDTAWKRRGAEYDTWKQCWSKRLLGELERHVPAVRGKVDFHELSTPLSTRHFANYENGEIYGLGHTPDRFRVAWLTPRTAVRGLYLTGQDVCTCGVTGALVGGLLTASAILGRNLISTATR
jgi:all-trans-retinol 13,14-reductase